jgi:hypothetical protein
MDPKNSEAMMHDQRCWSGRSQVGQGLCLGLGLLLWWLGLVPSLQAQEKQVVQSSQIWGGYISSIRISSKFSLWNDLHYVPESFFIMRHGLSVHLTDQITATGGYAWLNTAVAAQDNRLRRFEHRPWLQVMINLPIGEKYQISHRIRYDYRIRQAMLEGLPQEGEYIAYHRLRLMTSLRRPLVGQRLGNRIPYLTVGNELLVNFGKAITFNHFDQNRFWLMAGIQFSPLTIQFGYMHRFVQGASGYEFAVYHTPVLWITHGINSKGRAVEKMLHRDP